VEEAMNATRKIYEAPRLDDRGGLIEQTLGSTIVSTEQSFPPNLAGE
jgi:hypothetical protein